MPAVYRVLLRLSAALAVVAYLSLVPAWAQEKVDEVRMPANLTVIPDGVEPPLTTEQAPAPAAPAAPAKTEPVKTEPIKTEPAKAEKKPAVEKTAEKPAVEKPVAAKAEPAKAPAAAEKSQPLAAKPPKPEPARIEKKGPAEPKPAPGVGQVRSVQMEVKDGIFVLRVVTDRPVGEVKALNFKAPRRLAVDLIGPWHRHGDAVIRSNEGPVKSVRLGEHPDLLRLVLDFRNEGPGPDLAPEIVKTPDGVTVAFPVTP